MRIFLIFGLLITGICSPKHSFSFLKDKALKECGQILTDSCHKHVLCGSPNFDMELIINSPKHGRFAVLYDEQDHLLIKEYNWSLTKTKNGVFYAHTNTGVKAAKGNGPILMHRLILGFPLGCIDHKNHNGLDNTRENIRVCDQSKNIQNARTRKTSRSGYKGVCFEGQTKKWRLQIKTPSGKVIRERHTCKDAAAIAYNKYAIEYFGEFAFLNEVPCV